MLVIDVKKVVVFFENFCSFGTNFLKFLAVSACIIVNIGTSVTAIGEEAFYYCENLKEVIFEEGSRLSSISEGAFFNCKSLKNVELPNSVISIGDMAFLGCSSLESIIIPSSVTSIGDKVFANCPSLEKINFEENSQLISIGASAFKKCIKLKKMSDFLIDANGFFKNTDIFLKNLSECLKEQLTESDSQKPIHILI